MESYNPVRKGRDMCFKRLVLCFACTCASFVIASAPKSTTANDTLIELSRDASDPVKLQALKAALFDIADPEMKCLYGTVYCLGSLAMGSTQEGMLTRTQLLRTYAGSEMVKATLSDACISDECGDCGGRGMVETECEACQGNGRCRACGGNGRRHDVNQFSAPNCPACGGSGKERESYTSTSGGRLVRRWRETSRTCARCDGRGKLATGTVTCLACRGSGRCRQCEGKGRTQSPCSTCKGTRYVLSPGKCRAAYHALLAKAVTPIETGNAQAKVEQPGIKVADVSIIEPAMTNSRPVYVATPKPVVEPPSVEPAVPVQGEERPQVATTMPPARRSSFFSSPLLWIVIALIVGAWLISKVV